MNNKTFSYKLRKYPVLRAVLVVLLATVLLFLMLIFTFSAHKNPVVSLIAPKIANPGEVLVIYGQNFGTEQEDSYVEVGGLRLTATSCLEWTDERIRVKLPENIKDGLVFVVTRGGRSEAKIFTNKSAVPVKVVNDPTSALPVIYSTDEKSQSVGKLVTINGRNFGTMRNNAEVFFSWQDAETAQNSEYIACSENDYEYWSEEKIKVRVPDGAVSGSIRIVTEQGKSNNFPMTILTNVGKKNYSEKRTYVVDFTLEIKDAVFDSDDAVMVFRVPLPVLSDSQRTVELTESFPEPTIKNMFGTMVHQFSSKDFSQGKASAAHSFIVSTRKVTSQINEENVTPYSAICKQRNYAYLIEDSIVPCNDEKIKALAQKIAGKTKNPYSLAKLVYEYMTENFSVLDTIRSGDAKVVDLLKVKRGDCYDFAIMYCALLRNLGVAAMPVAGVLVDNSMQSQQHWWCEFYIENVGWIPVDVALGSGLKYDGFNFTRSEIPKEFYFGNLDAQHIAFSRGMNKLRPTMANSKIVFLPRTFALQSIWEESSEKVQSYSSYWTTPKISGVY